jgi:arsenate reductase
MNVAAAAKAAGISPSGLRWYESEGVLPPAPRGENGYRHYTDEDVSRLRLVLTLRRLGLSAPESGRLARLAFSGEEAATELQAALHRQQEAIAQRRADLDWLDGELRDLEVTWNATRAPRPVTESAAPISVLFLCNANSGRSQIGEALLSRLGGTRFQVQSAGANPAPVNEMTIGALSEVDIRWEHARSKRLDDVTGPFDYVITLSDSMREPCAAIPGRHSTLHWHLPDPSAAEGPADARLQAFRRVRDEISLRLVPFVELALRTAGPGSTR